MAVTHYAGNHRLRSSISRQRVELYLIKSMAKVKKISLLRNRHENILVWRRIIRYEQPKCD